MPNVHVTPIVGLPQFSGWSHVIEGTHSSPHRFVAVLAVSGKQASAVGRDVASLLLSETINSAEELYKKLAAAINLTEESGCHLAVGAALVSDKKTVFAVAQAAVFLRRQLKISTILQSDGPLKLIEGKRTEEDVFALVTEQATQFLGEIELKSKQGYDVDTIITSIVPGIHSQEDSSLSAFAFVTPVEGESEVAPQPLLQSQLDLVSSNNDNFTQDSIVPSTPADMSEVDPSTVKLIQEGPDVSLLDPAATASAPSRKKQGSLRLLLGSIGTVGIAVVRAVVAVWQWSWLLIVWLGRTIWGLIQASRGTTGSQADSLTPITYQSPVKQRRAKIMLVVLLLLVLAALAGVGYVVQTRNRELAQAEQLVAPLRAEVTAAQAEVETQPVVARDKVQRAIQELQALQATHSDSKRMVAVFAAEEAIAQQVFDSISGQEALAALPVFYDLRLVESDFVTTHTAQVGSQAVFLDAEQRQLIVLNLENKQVQRFTLAEGVVIRALAGGAENELLLLNGGIQQLALQPESQPETIKAEGESTRGGTLLGTFDRFVYVFNPTKRNLYRYAQQEDGYSDPIGWLQVSRGLDYATVSTMAIDGDIWLGSLDGTIRKFTSGEEQEFTITGMPQLFDSEIKIVTAESLEQLYVLEPARHRIVVLAKTGEFLRELSNQSLGAATGLIVSDTLGKAFAVSGATVFEVAL